MIQRLILVWLGCFCSLALSAATATAATTNGAASSQQPLTLRQANARLMAAKDLMSSNPGAVYDTAHAVGAQIVTLPVSNQKRIVYAKVKWLEGEALLRSGQPKKAAPLIDNGLKAIAPIRHPIKVRAYLLTSRGYHAWMTARFAHALRDFHTSFKIYQALDDPRGQAVSLQNIAGLYREGNDLATAMKYDLESADVYKGDESLSLSIHNNMGNSYGMMGDYQKAKDEYGIALKIAERMGSNLMVVRITINVAQADLHTGAYDKAAAALAKAARLSQEGDAAIYRPQIFAAEAELARRRGDMRGAVRLINQAFAEAGSDRDTLAYRDAHNTAYQAYKALGESGPALKHLEILKRLDDNSASLAASANTALMAARFDSANQTLKIAQLKAQDLQRKIAYERAHARTMRLVFVTAGGVTVAIICLLVAGLVVIRRSRNEERAAKDDLAVANTALAKALAAKTEFLATTSHEIRTPLNGILGMAQVMLAETGLPERIRDRLGVVHAAGVTMRALVDDILDVAKIETGNMTIERAPMDIAMILRDVAAIWRDQAQARGLEFVLDLDDCPARIEGDAARMRQIVFNLLSNAMKFTERGRITLRASIESGENGDRLHVAVGDTGIGIPADKRDEIFESFRQADASTTRRFGGTGLGLAICRNLCQAMNGDIQVVSEVGTGTTFTIDLPLLVAAGNIGEDERGMPRSALLIVDRNPITRSMLRAFLETRAGAIDLAAALPEAVERVADGGVETVLVDATAVEDLGDSADDALRRLVEAAGAAVETVLLWPTPGTEEIARFEGLGIGRVIAKPIAGPALAAALYPVDAVNGADPGDPHLVTDAA